MRRLILCALMVGSLGGGSSFAQPVGDPRAQAEAEFLRGIEFAERADWPEAIDHFERSVRMHPTVSGTLNLGLAYQLAGRCQEAIPVLERTLAMNPSPDADANARRSIAECQASLPLQVDRAVESGTAPRVEPARVPEAALQPLSASTAPAEPRRRRRGLIIGLTIAGAVLVGGVSMAIAIRPAPAGSDAATLVIPAGGTP